jgi:hypothetical protein
MYYYLFHNHSNPAPDQIYCGDKPPEGYVSFAGSPLADEQGNVNWSAVTHANGALTAIPTQDPEPTPVYVAPEPTAAEKQAALVNAVQSLLDASAKSRGYDNILSAVTYADEPSVSIFASEGQAYRQWRSECWAYCYNRLEQVMEGAQEVPTAPQLLSDLPPLSLGVTVIGNDSWGAWGNDAAIF